MSLLINAYSTLRELPPLDFPHALRDRRDRTNPELPDHLNGFIGYLLPPTPDDMTQQRFHLLRHIERVANHVSLEVEEDNLDAYSGWAARANAVTFLPDGSVRDPSGAVLFSPGGDSDADAEVPFPPDALARRERTVTYLGGTGVPVHANLPPVAGEGEVILQSPSDVARRALALFAVAIRAESLLGGEPIPVEELRERSPRSFDDLSPKEADFLSQNTPTEHDAVQFVWRYEALTLLLWSLGILDDLPFPTDVCNVPLVARTMIEADADALIATAALRPTGEILDALDLHYRLCWAARQAMMDGTDAPGGIEPGVAQERYYALNWLVRYQDAPWDDIEIPT